MTTQKQSGSIHSRFGLTLMPIEELTNKVEHLLERTLTGKEQEFLVLANGLLESNAKPLSKAKAGAA